MSNNFFEICLTVANHLSTFFVEHSFSEEWQQGAIWMAAFGRLFEDLRTTELRKMLDLTFTRCCCLRVVEFAKIGQLNFSSSISLHALRKDTQSNIRCASSIKILFSMWSMRPVFVSLPKRNSGIIIKTNNLSEFFFCRIESFL